MVARPMTSEVMEGSRRRPQDRSRHRLLISLGGKPWEPSSCLTAPRSPSATAAQAVPTSSFTAGPSTRPCGTTTCTTVQDRALRHLRPARARRVQHPGRRLRRRHSGRGPGRPARPPGPDGCHLGDPLDGFGRGPCGTSPPGEADVSTAS